MNTVGILLLAAATATTGIGKPHVGGKKFLRPHAVLHGPPPPGGPIDMAAMTAGASAMDPNCPPGMAGAGGAGLGAGAAGARRFPNVRSQLFFVEPSGMQIGWQTAAGNGERVYLPAQLSVPARYNFAQGYIYRLKLTNIPGGREGLTLYPTIEVAPSTPATDAYLTHNPIPVQFTEEDFDQVAAGNFVTKVIYLPDPRYQELAVSNVETLVSTRLEPGVDPILEADRRGTILLIVRMGGIDLEMPTSGVPGMSTVSGPDTVAPPLGPGGAPFVPPGTVLPSGPVDSSPSAPVSPAPGGFPTAPSTTPGGQPPAGEVAPTDEPGTLGELEPPVNPPGSGN
jgi:hypothetical protein